MKNKVYSKINFGFLSIICSFSLLSGCSSILEPNFNNKNQEIVTENIESNVFNVGDSIFAETKDNSYNSWVFGGYEISNAINGKTGISIIHNQQDGLSVRTDNTYTKIENTPFHYLVEAGTTLNIGTKKIRVIHIDLEANTIELSFVK